MLILGNFEQVLHARSQVAELLMACANLKVMVTSRFVLHLSCEQEFVVPPLAVPDLRYFPDPAILSGYEAVALFLARVQKFRPDFELTSVNAKAIVEICARLDGLPLADDSASGNGSDTFFLTGRYDHAPFQTYGDLRNFPDVIPQERM